jgi:hypothetical protein
MFQDLDDLNQGMKKVILKGGLMLASQFDCIPGERSYHILILFLWSHMFPHHFFAIILVDSSSFSQCVEFYSIESMQYTYICIYVYVYMYSRMCIHIYIIDVYTYIYMYIRVYIYTHCSSVFHAFMCTYVFSTHPIIHYSLLIPRYFFGIVLKTGWLSWKITLSDDHLYTNIFNIVI